MSLSNIFRRVSRRGSSSSCNTSGGEEVPPVAVPVAVPVGQPTQVVGAEVLLPDNVGGVHLTAKVQHPEVAYTDEIKTVISANIIASEIPESNAHARKPLDIVVVLDRSGSMSGGKLDMCKKTCDFLLSELKPMDRLGVVTFDNNVSTALPLTLCDASAVASASKTINEIRVGGSTNLSGGLIAGLSMLKSNEKKSSLSAGLSIFKSNEKMSEKCDEDDKRIQSVLLLTDGQANVGIRGQGIVNAAKAILGNDGKVSLHTFGYGEGHNADLLRQLSELSNGSFYFVEKKEEVGDAFANCLGGLTSVIAQNATLTVKVKAPHTISKIYTKRSITTKKKDEHMEIAIGDLYAGEEKNILIEISVKRRARELIESADADPLVEIGLSYFDIFASPPRFITTEEMRTTVGIRRPAVLDEVARKHVDCGIATQLCRENVVEKLAVVRSCAAAGDLAAGRTVLDQIAEQVSDLKARTALILNEHEMQLIEHLEGDIEEAKDMLKDKTSYECKGQYRMQNMIHQHGYQRGWDAKNCESLDVSSLDGGESFRFNGGKMKSAYTVGAAKSMMKKSGAFFR